MTEKDKLIKELRESDFEFINLPDNYEESCSVNYEEIADYIMLRDKKRNGESVTIDALKANPMYSHINIDAELGKARQWIARNSGRKLTSRFFVNWLNRIEKPLGKAPEQEAF